jgi:hypothetical protein
VLRFLASSKDYAAIQKDTLPLLRSRCPKLIFFFYVNRDTWRLHTTPLSLVLRKEYFDYPQRDSHAVHYIQKRGEMGVCTLVLCTGILANVLSSIDPSLRIVTKSPKVRPLLIFSISLNVNYTGNSFEFTVIRAL